MSATAASPQQSAAASATATATASLTDKLKSLRGWLDEFDGKDSAPRPSSDSPPRSPTIHHTYIWRSDSLPSLASNNTAAQPANSLEFHTDEETSRSAIKPKKDKKRAKGFSDQKALPKHLSRPAGSTSRKSQSRGRRRNRITLEDAVNPPNSYTALSSKAVESSDTGPDHTLPQKTLYNNNVADFQEEQSVETNDCVNHYGKTWSALNDCSASESSWHGKSLRVVQPEPIPVSEWLIGILGEYSMPNLSLDTFAGVAHRCEINPANGSFITPILHPDTYQCPEELDDVQMAWRRDNMSSELEIVQEIRRREKLALRINNILNDSVANQAIEEYQWPKADCIVRPVQENDFDEIAVILNAELGNTCWPQILCRFPFTSSDIKALFEFCVTKQHPFIVATTADDPLLDKSKWPANSTDAYDQYIRYKSQVDTKSEKKILGVAFVSVFKVGFLGTFSPATRHSGMLRVVVHPQHRRHNIGSALLDRLLVSTSLFYRNQVDYEWRCSKRNGTYEHPVTRNVRQYARLYIEIWCESSESPELVWRSKMLSQFGLSQVAYLTGAGKSLQSQGAKWQDLSLWELQVQPCEDVADSTR